jgi:hypothetical protein
MLLVHTQEISVNFTGFPISLGIPPDCTCSELEGAGCSSCGTITLIIDAAERDDGAAPQRLNFTCGAEDMKRLLREALFMLEGE